MAKAKSTGFSLKDELFNEQKIRFLAERFLVADKAFDAEGFVTDVMTSLKQLELKERINHIAQILERYLASDFRAACKQIVAALPPPLDPKRTDGDFGDFIFAPLGEFVVRNGLSAKQLNHSLRTLKAITQRFSMEDAIRWFINAFTEATLAELADWSVDKNYHVRRLVSEGTRPILPWSKRLTIEHTVPLDFLDTLHADSTRYVTRSVANHLNDISKTDARLVLRTLKRWKKLARQDPAELTWMTKHALRSLVKQGNVAALDMLGFRQKPCIEITNFRLQRTAIMAGEAIEMEFTLTALRKESLLVDYVIDFVKANGILKPKVHKLKQLTLEKGESVTIAKRHPLRANATTYTLYPGTHKIALQINGLRFEQLPFELSLA